MYLIFKVNGQLHFCIKWELPQRDHFVANEGQMKCRVNVVFL